MVQSRTSISSSTDCLPSLQYVQLDKPFHLEFRLHMKIMPILCQWLLTDTEAIDFILRVSLFFSAAFVHFCFSFQNWGGRCWAKDKRAKTNGFSRCYLAAGALNGSLKTPTLKKHNKVAGGSLQSNSTEHDRKVCNLKSQLSRSRYWGHNNGPIAPRGQGMMPQTSVSFMRILHHFCLPGKKHWASSPSSINKTPDTQGAVKQSNLFLLSDDRHLRSSLFSKKMLWNVLSICLCLLNAAESRGRSEKVFQ